MRRRGRQNSTDGGGENDLDHPGDWPQSSTDQAMTLTLLVIDPRAMLIGKRWRGFSWPLNLDHCLTVTISIEGLLTALKKSIFLSYRVECLHFILTIQKCYIIHCVFWHLKKKIVTQKALEIIWYGTAKGITGRIWNSINLGAFVKIYCCVSSLGCTNQTPASVACSWYPWLMIGTVIYH